MRVIEGADSPTFVVVVEYTHVCSRIHPSEKAYLHTTCSAPSSTRKSIECNNICFHQGR